jgi:hypothetical protein
LASSGYLHCVIVARVEFILCAIWRSWSVGMRCFATILYVFLCFIFLVILLPCFDWPRACVIIYSCCSRLEHRASAKRFVSLQFLNLRQSVGLLEREISPTQDRYLHTGQHKRLQISLPSLGFEPTTSVFERAKTFYALDRAVTAIGVSDSAEH